MTGEICRLIRQDRDVAPGTRRFFMLGMDNLNSRSLRWRPRVAAIPALLLDSAAEEQTGVHERSQGIVRTTGDRISAETTR
jgi:hypothetical protein